MEVKYIQHSGSDLLAVNAARTSFSKVSNLDANGNLVEKDARLIRFLAREKHFAPFEHLTATLHLKVPIFIARQIQRHRTFSYSEISRRYVDSPPEFFWPDKWRRRAENVKQGSSDEEAYITHAVVWQAMNSAVAAYDHMLAENVAPEQARMLLPQNLYTEMYMSGNLRAWAHFLHLRLDGHAQAEVQDVAQMVADILNPLFPVSMKALLDNT